MSGEKKRSVLSAIMPALNEEENISNAILHTLEAFEYFKLDGEIIVVDDGSSDKTYAIAERAAAEKPDIIRLIKHDKTEGIGASFWDGVELAKGDAVVMFPGDDENDPKESLRYYRLLEHVDIVIPFIFNKEARSIFRNALSYAFRFIVNTTFLVNFNYTNGTVLYRKSILGNIDNRSHSFFFQTDILIRATKMGYLFAEVPYKLGARGKGVSKAVNFPSFYKVAKGYLTLVRDYYFSKDKGTSGSFSEDSLTAIRRQGPPGGA